MSNKTYDNMKFAALVFLPLFTTFVGTVLETLHFPSTGTIVTIMTAFNTFTGALVKAASDSYNKLNG